MRVYEQINALPPEAGPLSRACRPLADLKELGVRHWDVRCA